MVEALHEQFANFLRPDETAADLFARCNHQPSRSGVATIDVHGGLHPRQIVEVVGPVASGKTEILTQAAAHAILPQHLGGLCVGALMIDLDARFDFLRLVQILRSRLHHLRVDAALSEDTIQQALARFHLVRCHNTYELLLTLKTLPTWITTATPQPIKLVLVDNIDAYYWMDRVVQPSAYPALNAHAAATCVAAQLASIVVGHALLCITTRSDPGLYSTWHMQRTVPAAWQDVVAKRMLLQAQQPDQSRWCKWQHALHNTQETQPMKFEIQEHCIALHQH